MHARKRIQLAFHDVKVIHVKIVNLSHGLHLIYIADGSDDVIFVGGKEIFDSFAAKSGGAAGDNY